MGVNRRLTIMSAANQIIKANTNLNELQTDANTFRVLQETLYPGSTDQEVSMILSYCKARRIDPILKPVHLVPMSVKTDKKDKDGKFIYERKNVIMPGVGLYRIDASRSGQYAGMDEPEFGEDITETIGKVKLTYPKWCKIKVKKLLANGDIAEFTAKEYWKENYATKSNFDNSPNMMWEKRAYGQLAKCAEAQALRKAFPDIVGNEYTKEEMEGKTLYHEDTKPEKTQKPLNQTIEGEVIENIDLTPQFETFMQAIKASENENDLREVFNEIKKVNFKSHPDLFKKLIEAKDIRKNEIVVKEFNDEINEDTGEVVS